MLGKSFLKNENLLCLISYFHFPINFLQKILLYYDSILSSKIDQSNQVNERWYSWPWRVINRNPQSKKSGSKRETKNYRNFLQIWEQKLALLWTSVCMHQTLESVFN